MVAKVWPMLAASSQPLSAKTPPMAAAVPCPPAKPAGTMRPKASLMPGKTAGKTKAPSTIKRPNWAISAAPLTKNESPALSSIDLSVTLRRSPRNIVPNTTAMSTPA